MRRFVVRPFFWLLAILAIVVLAATLLLRSEFLRQRAQALLVAQLREALARDATVGELQFTLLPLSIEVKDLVIPGRTASDPPLVSVARVRVEGQWEGIRTSAPTLSEVVAERPRVDLRTYPDVSTNLPEFAGGGETRRSLEVRVHAPLLHAGRFRLNDEEIPPDLVADAVHRRLVRAKRGNLRGDVIVERVDLSLPNAHPIPVAISASVLLGASGLQVENGHVRAPGLTATAAGTVGWGDATSRGELRFNVDAASSTLQELGYITDQVSADALHSEGSVWWGAPPESAPGAAVPVDSAHRWGVAATVTAPRAVVLGRQVEDLQATGTVDRDRVNADIRRATYHGGAVTGKMIIDLASDGYPADLKLAVSGAEVAPLLLEQGVPFSGVAGKATGNFGYRFKFLGGAAGSGEADARIEPMAAGPHQIAMGGAAALHIDRGVLALDSVDLSAPAQHLTGSGRYDIARGRGAFDFSVETDSVGDLAPVVPVATPQLWLPSAGRGTLSAHLGLEPEG